MNGRTEHAGPLECRVGRSITPAASPPWPCAPAGRGHLRLLRRHRLDTSATGRCREHRPVRRRGLTRDMPVRYHVDYRTLCRHVGEFATSQLILTHMSPSMPSRLGLLGHTPVHDGLRLGLYPLTKATLAAPKGPKPPRQRRPLVCGTSNGRLVKRSPPEAPRRAGPGQPHCGPSRHACCGRNLAKPLIRFVIPADSARIGVADRDFRIRGLLDSRGVKRCVPARASLQPAECRPAQVTGVGLGQRSPLSSPLGVPPTSQVGPRWCASRRRSAPPGRG